MFNDINLCENMNRKESRALASKNARKAVMKLIVWIAAYIAVTLATLIYLPALYPPIAELVASYSTYITLGLTIAFGYAIVQSIADLAYWTIRIKQPHSTAAAARSLIKLLGLGAIVAVVIGGAVGGASAVALGGFIGMVIGFATQQALSQAIAGMFLLLVRPIKIGDRVTVAGETGIVEDVSTMYTKIRKEDGTLALVPNSTILGGKIFIHKNIKEKTEESQ
ncbi:MAG: mechanosensitive ion channel family protein [Thermoprotei archaeon]|nr:MAG: mechanosensitive ion channel family protein [Thermoprotei archaeon]